MATELDSFTLAVTNNDIHDYFNTLSNKCKIWRFRMSIIDRMPVHLRKEFSNKFNDLVQVNYQEGIFKFKARDCTEDLNNYLSQFAIVVDKNI